MRPPLLRTLGVGDIDTRIRLNHKIEKGLTLVASDFGLVARGMAAKIPVPARQHGRAFPEGRRGYDDIASVRKAGIDPRGVSRAQRLSTAVSVIRRERSSA